MTVVDPQSLDAQARALYNDHTANDPAIHCNRFPLWRQKVLGTS